MHILADRSITNLEAYFPLPLSITYYDHPKDIPALSKAHSILLCRSTLKVNAQTIQDHRFTYVATLSSGIDHLDATYLHRLGTAILHAKGCNAVSVVDYTTSVLASLQVHHHIAFDKIAIIGVGAVGYAMHQRFARLKIPHILYDPIRDAKDETFHSATLEEVYRCNILCLCANLHHENNHPSYNLINHRFINNMGNNSVIINIGRGELVDEQAILSTKKTLYCADVFHDEPNVSKAIIDYSAICTPHIAGQSIEGKSNALLMISKQLHTLYGLSIPTTLEKTVRFTPSTLPKDWISYALSQYNPDVDSQKLKTSSTIAQTFLNIRQSHYRVIFDPSPTR